MRDACDIFRTLLLLCSLLPLQALAGDAEETDGYEHITSADGLSSNYVRSLYRDRDGFVWIGTIVGLDRFDGVEIRNFPLPHPGEENAKKNVADICADASGILVVSQNDLYQYDRRTDSLYARYRFEGNRTGTAVQTAAHDSLIFVGTTGGLYLLDRRFGLRHTLLAKEPVIDLARSERGCVVLTPHRIYLAVPRGLDEPRVVPLTAEQPEFTFSCVACRGDTVFAGTKFKGVYAVSKDGLARLPHIENEIITALFVKEERLYVGSNGSGMTCYDFGSGTATVHTNRPERRTSLASNAVYSLFVDDTGICWAGSYSHGVSFTSRNIHSFRQYRALEGNSIRSFRLIGPDNVLAGSRNGLIHSVNGVNRTYRKEDFPAIRSDIVLSLSEYGTGRHLVGTFGGGIYLYDSHDGSIAEYPLDAPAREQLVKESVYGSTRRGNEVYLITLNGLFVLEQGRIALHYTEHDTPMPSSQLFSFLEDPDGLWLGTSRGLCRYRFRDKTVSAVSFGEMANDVRINHIYGDSRGDLWLCADKYGLIRYRPQENTAEAVGQQAGIPPELVSGIVEAGDGLHYWVSTGKGIFRYNSETGGVKPFGEGEGMSSASFCPGACCRMNDTYYFGSEDGLVFFTDAPSSLPRDARVVITDFDIAGEKVRRGDPRLKQSADGIPTIIVREGDDLRLRVVVPDFRDTRPKTFAYRMTPGHDDWTYTYDNTVPFENVAEGHYSLSFRCSDDEITWSDARVLLQIEVRRPVTRTFGFRAAVVFAGAALLFGAWRLRRRALDAIAKHARDWHKKFRSPVREEAWMPEAIDRMKRFMEERRPYINPDFSIKELSDNVGFSMHQLSHVLNSVMGTNFAAFVNNYRVEAVKRMLDSDEINRLTLFAVAEKCGFSSKTSFHRVFKNVTGFTPQEYRKQLGKKI